MTPRADRLAMPVVLENSVWGDQKVMLTDVTQIEVQLREHAQSRHMMRKKGWLLPDADHRWGQLHRNTDRLLDAWCMFAAVTRWESMAWGVWEPAVHAELGLAQPEVSSVAVAA